MLTAIEPLGEPLKVITLNIQSDKLPSLVVRLITEVQTPAKKSHANNKTPAKKKWVIKKKQPSPHVKIPPSPDS